MTRHKSRRDKKLSNISDDELSDVPRLLKLPVLRTDLSNCGKLDSSIFLTEETDPSSMHDNKKPVDFGQERRRVAENVIRRYTTDTSNIPKETRQRQLWNQKNHYPFDSDNVHVQTSIRFGHLSYQEDERPFLNSAAQRELELDKKRQAMLERRDREVQYSRKCKKAKTEVNDFSTACMPTGPKQETKKMKRNSKSLNKSKQEDDFLQYDRSDDTIWKRHIPIPNNYTYLPPPKYHILPPIQEHQHVNRQADSVPVDVAGDSSDSECFDVELDNVYVSGHSEIVLNDEKLRQELKLDLSFTKTPEPRRKTNTSSKQNKSKDTNKTTRRDGKKAERLC